MRVELTIDDLVLDGFDPRDRNRIADAVERELTALRWPGRSTLPLHRAGRSPGREDDGSPSAIARSVGLAISDALAARTVR